MVQLPACARRGEQALSRRSCRRTRSTLQPGWRRTIWVWFAAVVADDGVMVIGVEIVTLVEAVALLPSVAVPVTWQAGCDKER